MTIGISSISSSYDELSSLYSLGKTQNTEEFASTIGTQTDAIDMTTEADAAQEEAVDAFAEDEEEADYTQKLDTIEEYFTKLGLNLDDSTTQNGVTTSSQAFSTITKSEDSESSTFEELIDSYTQKAYGAFKNSAEDSSLSAFESIV